MLENEPTTAGAAGPGDNSTTEQTPKVTRRRRAASRPAGPPPEEAERAAGLLTEPAPEPAPKPAFEPAPEPAPGEQADAGGEATQPERNTSDGVAPSAATARQDQPEQAEQPAKPRRTRTRKTQAAAEDAEAAPPRRSRTRRQAAPAEETPLAAADAVTEAGAKPGVGTGDEPSAKVGTEAGVEAGPEVGTADAPEPVAAEQDELPEEEPLDDEPPGEDLEDLTEENEDDAVDQEAAADDDEDEDEDEETTGNLLADPFGLATQALRRAKTPGVLFQPPTAVFQPIFQAPEPYQARARWEPVRGPEPEIDEIAEADDAEEAEDAVERGEEETSDETGGRRRRRRRGGRNRSRGRDGEETEESSGEAEEAAQAGADEAEAEDQQQAEPAEEQETVVTGSRRRRRRRRRAYEEGEEPAGDDPPNTVVRIRAPRVGRPTSLDEVQGVRGSTRLEAKKQRRREGRELGRRRPPIITESEFLARRESVERVMVVRRHAGRTQIAVLEDGILVEHYVDRESSQSYVGNVYLGKVQNVLPSMEAAFIDIGKGRNAVLYAGEVNFDTAGLEGQPKRIESALKSGQSVLVQVTKDPIGHKGARLTSQISLPGRYLVYVPDGSMTGISRKLPDKERTRLKSILKKVMPENAGVIVRTAAEGASEEELSRDVARLSAQWENIQRKTKSSSPPELLYSEPDLTIRVVRDVFNEDFSSLVVAGDGSRDDVWATVQEYVRYVAPHLEDRLSRWEGEGDVFAAYRIDEQIAKALERKVWLPSGGSLVIDRTEAMTVIDVNTGKFTGQGGNLEETVTRNNLEAAEEIVRQLRLRDIGGIIVIDFIDMVLESNRDLVLRRMLECLARDRTKHQVAEVTSLGLVQMTRKRVGQGLLEAFSTPCDCCGGRGLITSTEPVDGKPEPRGTQGKMAIEKAVAEKVAEKMADAAVAASAVAARDTVTGALNAAEEPVGEVASGRARRRTRRVKQAE
ncbi:Rne/Rng family ribonuclease [Thermopolyspora sp. NPDC052614]|uniref:Rne/Rng family ribonuclease n=1 Tax=Thermopolyspora sp. NPDC052614 TaxID=3155682 RepID=UPI003431E18F